MPALLAPEHPFSFSFCHILQNKSMPNVSKTVLFYDRSIHLPYFVSFVSSNSDISLIRENIFVKIHIAATENISNYTNIFSSEHDDVKMLVADLKERFLTLASNTQCAESKTKDLTYCKN